MITRQIALLLAISALALTSGCGRDDKARVIFENRSACGTITATLTDTETGEVQQTQVANDQRVELIVRPSVFYEYVVDFTSAGRTAAGLRCTRVSTGRVRVPAGTSQPFILQAETPVP
jgi:hypothetical protein